MIDGMKQALSRVQEWASAGGLKVLDRGHSAKRPMAAIAAAALLVTGLSGCASMGPNEGMGALIGAGAGAVIGNALDGGHGGGRYGHRSNGSGGAIVGALVGAGVGGAVGRNVDMQEWMRDQQFAEVAHRGPMGHRYERPYMYRGAPGRMYVTPRREYRNTYGYCRDYQTEIVVGRHVEMGVGTACLGRDGYWHVVRAPRPVW